MLTGNIASMIKWFVVSHQFGNLISQYSNASKLVPLDLTFTSRGQYQQTLLEDAE